MTPERLAERIEVHEQLLVSMTLTGDVPASQMVGAGHWQWHSEVNSARGVGARVCCGRSGEDWNGGAQKFQTEKRKAMPPRDDAKADIGASGNLIDLIICGNGLLSKRSA